MGHRVPTPALGVPGGISRRLYTLSIARSKYCTKTLITPHAASREPRTALRRAVGRRGCAHHQNGRFRSVSNLEISYPCPIPLPGCVLTVCRQLVAGSRASCGRHGAGQEGRCFIAREHCTFGVWLVKCCCSDAERIVGARVCDFP